MSVLSQSTESSDKVYLPTLLDYTEKLASIQASWILAADFKSMDIIIKKINV